MESTTSMPGRATKELSMNWVTTVIGFSELTVKLDPGPKKVWSPSLQLLKSHPSLSQNPSYLSPEALSPQGVPSHLTLPTVSQVCGVYAVAKLFDSQMSISTQQLPYLPVPALTSLSLAAQPSAFASPVMNFMSWGH